MGRSIPDVKFELRNVYKTFADQLMLSNNVSEVLLDNADIHAAGGQVEGSLRHLLSELLPERVKVSHGHIVDKYANISYQQDILVTDSLYTRSLIKTLDGTEFYPFEAIFLTGEIKKKWSTKNFKSTIASIERNKNKLKRNNVAPNALSAGTNPTLLSDALTKNEYRNPLFSFTFSIDYDNSFSESTMRKLYEKKSDWHKYPNVSVVLNSGIYLMVDKDGLDKNELIVKLYPEFVRDDENCCWALLRLNPEECLAYLVFILIQHINDTVLEMATALDYSQSMLDISLHNLSLF